MALLVYGFKMPLRHSSPFFSALEKESLFQVEGRLSSSPAVMASGKLYSMKLSLSSVMGKCSRAGENAGLVESSACGSMMILVPSVQVESLYPGRLYSKCPKGGFVLDEGERILCLGSYSGKYKAFVAEKVEHLGTSSGLAGRLMHFRALLRLNFKRLMFSWGKAGALILSLLSGSREYLGQNIKEKFRLAGLSHVLALSGMHLSFFSGLSGTLYGKVFGKKYMRLAELAGILFFIWFAGLSPSLFRAMLCSLILLLSGALFCLEVEMLHVLSISFLLHIVIFPQDSQSLAFILSYGALAGILLFSQPLKRFFVRFQPPGIAEGLAASAGAQAFTAPVSLACFSSFAPGGIIASTVVSPMVSFFMALSLLFIVLSLLLPFLSSLFGGILNGVYFLLEFFIRLFAAVPCVSLGNS